MINFWEKLRKKYLLENLQILGFVYKYRQRTCGFLSEVSCDSKVSFYKYCNVVKILLSVIFILYVQSMIYLSWRYRSESARIPIRFILHTSWKSSHQSLSSRKLPNTVLIGDNPTTAVSVSTPASNCFLPGTWKGAFCSPSKLRRSASVIHYSLL